MPQGIEAPAGTTAEGLTSHTQNQDGGGLARLREDFPPEQIQHLPRLKCPACRDSRTGVCDNPRHIKAECKECGNYVSVWHVHLDYVGHAELTNRLLDADPLWQWEPVAFDQRGLPAFDENGGLWIRLTVCGHTRLGYGDAQGKRGPNAVKEAIGDALRNAAMRFGAALDLWAKSDLRMAQTEHPRTAEEDIAQAGSRVGRASREAAESRPGRGSESSEEAFARLTEQYRNCWGNALALAQIRIEGRQLGLSKAEVQGPPPESAWTTFDALLESRIEELKAAQGGAEERGAA